jgi:hypothetical protein
MAMMIQVVVFWVMTPCSDVVGYQRFGGPCCLHLQGEVSEAWIENHRIVMWWDTNVSEDHAASIFRVKCVGLG